MPDFPRYESKGQLTTQVPSAGAVQETGGQMMEQAGKVFGQTAETMLKWGQALDTIQKTTSTANFKSGMADILNRAQNDPDYNNSAQYVQEMEKLKSQNLKGFQSKTAETETAIEFGYESKVGQIQLDNIYKKKVIDVGQASTLKIIDGEVNNPTFKSLGNIKKTLQAQVDAGVYSEEAAYRLYQKANDDIGVNRISKDLYSAQTPEQVEQVSQNITSGVYEQYGVTIDPDKKKSLLEIADRAKINTEKRLQAQQVEAIAKNRVDKISQIASGQVPFENLDMTQISAADPQLASTLTKVKDFLGNYNPKLPMKEQALAIAGLTSENQIRAMRDYARTITDTFMQDNNEQLGQFMLRELEKKGDGLTPSVKLAAFANLAALKYRSNNPQTSEDMVHAERLNSIKNAVAFIKATNPYTAPFVMSDFIVKNFLSGAKGQEEVMSEARGVIKSKALERHPSIANLPSLPNKVVDGDAAVEDLHSGNNELNGEAYNGNYGDQNSGD